MVETKKIGEAGGRGGRAMQLFFIADVEKRDERGRVELSLGRLK